MSNGIEKEKQFEQWEVEMVKKKARRLIGKYGFTESDKEDLEQQLLLHMFVSHSIKKFSGLSLLEWKEGASRTLDNKIRKIKEHAKRDKRSVNLRKENLVETFDEDVDGESRPWILSESEAKSQIQNLTEIQTADLSEAMESALEKLTAFQKSIVNLRMEGRGIQEVAKILGCDRTTVFRQTQIIKKIFKEAGLGR